MDQTRIARQTGKVNPCDRMINFMISKRQSCGCESNTIHNNNRIISSLYEAVGDSAWHTSAMNSLVTNVLEKQHLEDIVELLPDIVRLWSQHFRFACVKSELTSSNLNINTCRNLSGSFKNMTTILHVKNQDFNQTYVEFDACDFIPHFDQLIEYAGTTFFVRILKNGKQVYGYTVDEFDTLEHRELQRCNEFGMFLTHSINTVLHNFELNQLNLSLEKAYEEIATLSIHDPMTGIYNRRGFFQTTKSLILDKSNYGKYLNIAIIDMDGLKSINDNYGHSEGDFSINAIAHSLKNIDADNLICTRFGGDEFTCTFLSDTADAYTSEHIQTKISEALSKINGVSDKEYPISFSTGLSTQLIDENIDIESIISRADAMMYTEKAAKKAH